MVDNQTKKSSGIAKAGLATAIAVGGLNLLNGNVPILGGLSGGYSGAAPIAATAAADTTAAIVLPAIMTAIAGGGNKNNEYVTEKSMSLIREISAKDATIGKLEAEKYADGQITAHLAPVYTLLNEQSKEICNLKSALAMESERRSCGDEKIVTFVEGNYIRAEKSLNSRKINYHGVKPTLQLDECCCDENGVA